MTPWCRGKKDDVIISAFERRLNARGYIEALTEYSFSLLGYFY